MKLLLVVLAPLLLLITAFTVNPCCDASEAEVRDWLERIGEEPLTGLAHVEVVSDGITVAGTGCGIRNGTEYFGLPATIQLNGTAFQNYNDAQRDFLYMKAIGHEYGHVWAEYYQCVVWQLSWDAYLIARGIDPNDPRLDNSPSCWNPVELAAEDYRELFGGKGPVPSGIFDVPYAAQCGWPMAVDIPGFREWYGTVFTNGNPPPNYDAQPTPTPTITPTPTPTPRPEKCPPGWQKREIC